MKRPWCCPEPKCTPVFQLKDSDYEDITQPVTGESFFCFGMMAQPVAFSYDGVEHNNDLNSCSYTALKGVIRFQENEGDWEALETAYRRARQKVKDIRRVATSTGRTRVEGEHAGHADAFCLACNEHPCKLLAAAPAESLLKLADQKGRERAIKALRESRTTTKGDR